MTWLALRQPFNPELFHHHRLNPLDERVEITIVFHPRGLNRRQENHFYCARPRFAGAFAHQFVGVLERDWRDWDTSLRGHVKRAFLEGKHFAWFCARAFGANAKRDPRAQTFSRDAQTLHRAVFVRPIDRNDIYESHSVAENRRVQQLFLRDHSHATPRESEQRCGIEIRPMVGHKDVSSIWIDLLATDDFHFHPAQSQPIARAPIRPPINPVLFFEKNPEDEDGRGQNKQQQSGDEPRPRKPDRTEQVRAVCCVRLRGAIGTL